MDGKERLPSSEALLQKTNYFFCAAGLQHRFAARPLNGSSSTNLDCSKLLKTNQALRAAMQRVFRKLWRLPFRRAGNAG
jgi:hypothetical protein